MIYISGAVSGVPNRNWEQFKKAEDLLTSRGLKVVNPLKLDHSQCKKYIEHMRVDTRELKKCKAIYMMKGSELSRGARIEKRIAIKHGIEIIEEDE